jgi:hypothetical protein
VASAGCLARRPRVTSQGIGRVRLGDTRARMTARAGAPAARTARVSRFCVRGGGRVAAVFSSTSANGRARFVATSAPGARWGKTRVRSSLRTLRRGHVRLRRAGPGLYRVGTRRSRVFVGVRGKRVAFLAVADRLTATRAARVRQAGRRLGRAP